MASSLTAREQYFKERELEEARKAGTAPPAKDEDGRDINPHIPQYIAQAPWYLQRDHPGLKHQRRFDEGEEPKKETWYKRGQKAGPAAKRWRKGACGNCGAMTHTAKDCTERPRKLGARFTNKNIEADEVVEDIELGYDAKRDRWNGYDPQHHLKDMMKRFGATEAKRRKIKEKEALEKAAKESKEKDKAKGDGSEEKTKAGEAEDSDEDFAEKGEEEEEFKTAEDPETQTMVRNLRAREDTAKYLFNLDPNSAFYDPKSRSLRGNPFPGKSAEEVPFAGDAAAMKSGEFSKVMQLQSFAWEAVNKGKDVNVSAGPSAAELMHKTFLERKKKLEAAKKDTVLGKYGGAEHLETPDKALLLGQTEVQGDFRPDGSKKMKTHVVLSRYEEDIFPMNHQTVFGSWFDVQTGKWGYACCHQVERNHYCTGALTKAQAVPVDKV